MAFTTFKKQFLDLVNVESPPNLLRVINSLQQAVDDSLSPMVGKYQNDSNLLTNISLEAGKVNIVNHTLGRKLSGWQIIRQRSQASIWDAQDSNNSPTLNLYLQTSANVVVDLLVF